MLNHNYEIIEPQHWTDLVSPRSKLSMHFFGLNEASQSASVPKSRAILPADIVLEPCWQGGRGDCYGNDGGRWRLLDGKVEYLCSNGIWVELKDAGGIGRNQLRVAGTKRRILGWVKRGSHDVIVDYEKIPSVRKVSRSNAHRGG